MTEDESFTKKVDYLIGRIDMLERALGIAIATMPETQRDYISAYIRDFFKDVDKGATIKDTDAAKDHSAGTWDTGNRMHDIIVEWAEDYEYASRE